MSRVKTTFTVEVIGDSSGYVNVDAFHKAIADVISDEMVTAVGAINSNIRQAGGLELSTVAINTKEAPIPEKQPLPREGETLVSATEPTEDAQWISDRLTKKRGYYDWTPLNADHTVFRRDPVPERNLEEEWLKDEQPEVIHFCDVTKYRKSIENYDKLGSSLYIGYVREGACYKCGLKIEVGN